MICNDCLERFEEPNIIVILGGRDTREVCPYCNSHDIGEEADEKKGGD